MLLKTKLVSNIFEKCRAFWRKTQCRIFRKNDELCGEQLVSNFYKKNRAYGNKNQCRFMQNIEFVGVKLSVEFLWKISNILKENSVLNFYEWCRDIEKLIQFSIKMSSFVDISSMLKFHEEYRAFGSKTWCPIFIKNFGLCGAKLSIIFLWKILIFWEQNWLSYFQEIFWKEIPMSNSHENFKLLNFHQIMYLRIFSNIHDKHRCFGSKS